MLLFDSMGFVDDDSRVYMYYSGQYLDGIWGVELNPKELTSFRREPRRFLRPNHHEGTQPIPGGKRPAKGAAPITASINRYNWTATSAGTGCDSSYAFDNNVCTW